MTQASVAAAALLSFESAIRSGAERKESTPVQIGHNVSIYSPMMEAMKEANRDQDTPRRIAARLP